jgi:hypothetical protein
MGKFFSFNQIKKKFIIIHFSLCPNHYHEHRAKSIAQTSPSPSPEPLSASPTSPIESVITSPSSKRRRANSPLSTNQSQSSIADALNKSSIPKPNRRLSIAVIPPTVNIEHPNKGDLIQMENGSRKKFDGVVWRTICSLPGCLIAAQRNELCRKHFIKLNGKPNNAPTMAPTMVKSDTIFNDPLSDDNSPADDKLGRESIFEVIPKFIFSRNS